MEEASVFHQPRDDFPPLSLKRAKLTSWPGVGFIGRQGYGVAALLFEGQSLPPIAPNDPEVMVRDE